MQLIVVSALIAISNAGVLQAPQAYLAHDTTAHHVEYHAPAAVTYHHGPTVLHTPAIGTSSKSITRTLDGTVSQYTKAVDTAFSSVRKADTRVSNKVYRPAYAYDYVHQPTVVAHQVHQPTIVSHQVHQPTVVSHHVHQPTVYTQQVHAPATLLATTHHQPSLTSVAKTQYLNAPRAHIAYSPAELVSHVEYSAPLVHYAW